MWEALIAAALLVTLLVAGWAHNFVGWLTLLRVGVWLIVGGTALSVAAGLFYHAALYRCLQPRGALAARWWLAPTRLHAVLTLEEQRRVLPWFLLGAAAFVVVMLGCATVLLSVWHTG